MEQHPIWKIYHFHWGMLEDGYLLAKDSWMTGWQLLWIKNSHHPVKGVVYWVPASCWQPKNHPRAIADWLRHFGAHWYVAVSKLKKQILKPSYWRPVYCKSCKLCSSCMRSTWNLLPSVTINWQPLHSPRYHSSG